MNRKQVYAAAVGFLTGLTVAWLGLGVVAKNKASVNDERGWFVCTRVNMSLISDAIANYFETNTGSGPIDLGTLVHAKLLPQWSEIYICPAQCTIMPLRSNYDESFRSNLFRQSPIAAHFSNCSYYIEALPDSVRVRCLYHSNVLDFAVSKKHSINFSRP